MNGLQISILALVISLGLFNFFLWLSVIGTATKGRRKVTERISNITQNSDSIFDAVNKSREQKKKMLENKAKGVRSERQQKLMTTIFDELILADILMRPEEFCMVWLIIIFGPSGLAALFQAGPIPSVTLAVVGVVVPIIFLNTKKKKRTKVFESQLGDSLVIICNCLRSGLSFQQAMDNIATEMSKPISIEFSRAVNEIKYGATMETALNNMVKRVKSPDLMLAMSAVNIQRQTGGNLSEILESISGTIRERLRIKGEIASLTAQGRMSGMLIGALPAVIAVILLVVTPDYLEPMYTTTIGKIMLLVAVVMEIMGFFAIRKVVTIEY